MNNVILLAGTSVSNISGEKLDAFENAGNRPLIWFLLKTYEGHPDVDEIGVVCAAGYERRLRSMAYRFGITKLKWIVCDSRHHTDEQIAAAEATKRYCDDDIVIIQDCSRPNVTDDIISECIVSATLSGSGIASLECDNSEFLYNSEPLKGQMAVLIQSPCAYSLNILKKAKDTDIERCGIYNSLVSAGERLHFCAGSAANFAVSDNKMLALFQKLYADREKSRNSSRRKVDLNKLKQEENDGTMVTVVCTTYNHEKYIAQALDSFVMQKTNFKFKVFVGEDCGPDHTKDIVLDYARRYPDIIVPFIREKNMGATRNTIDMTSQATSPYICFCEGDDYWIDEYKLQKQFDYMEEHKDYTFCFARTEVGGYLGDFGSYYKPDENGKYIYPDCEPGYVLKDGPYTAADFIEKFPEHTSTYFFRWDYNIEFPDWYYQGIMGDIPLRLIQMRDGLAGYIPDVVSVYRRNETGSFSKFRDKDRMFIATRAEYVRWLSGMIKFYSDNNICADAKNKLQNRIKVEYGNLINSAINKLDDYNAVLSVMEKYPDAAEFILKYYLSADNDRRTMEGAWGWDGYQAVVRNRYVRKLLQPYAKICGKILAKRQKGKRK